MAHHWSLRLNSDSGTEMELAHEWRVTSASRAPRPAFGATNLALPRTGATNGHPLRVQVPTPSPPARATRACAHCKHEARQRTPLSIASTPVHSRSANDRSCRRAPETPHNNMPRHNDPFTYAHSSRGGPRPPTSPAQGSPYPPRRSLRRRRPTQPRRAAQGSRQTRIIVHENRQLGRARWPRGARATSGTCPEKGLSALRRPASSPSR